LEAEELFMGPLDMELIALKDHSDSLATFEDEPLLGKKQCQIVQTMNSLEV